MILANASLRPGDAVPALRAGESTTPAREFLKSYVRDLWELPGLVNVRYPHSAGDSVTLLFRTEAQRMTAESLLEPALDGVRILTARSEWTGGSPDPDTSLWKHTDAFVAVNALPGVWKMNSLTHFNANGTVTFNAINERTMQHLDRLIRDELPGIVGAGGQQFNFAVSWKAGVPV